MPQLYVMGKFVGGIEKIEMMHLSGELSVMFGAALTVVDREGLGTKQSIESIAEDNQEE